MVVFWLRAFWLRCVFWLRVGYGIYEFGYVLVTTLIIWLRYGYATFWLRFGYDMVTFWLRNGYVFGNISLFSSTESF